MMERLKQAYDMQSKLARTDNRMTVLEENVHRLHLGKNYMFPPPRDANDMIRINIRGERKPLDLSSVQDSASIKRTTKQEKFDKIAHNMKNKLDEANKLIENFKQLK
jgi:hypothetical protein